MIPARDSVWCMFTVLALSCLALSQGAPQQYFYYQQPQQLQPAPGYNLAPVSYNPAVQQYPPGFFYGGYGGFPGYGSGVQQPQFVFLYPGSANNIPGAIPGAIPAANPVPVPTDDTGDAETVITEADEAVSSEREPLSPGIALSGAEAGQRVTPEKTVSLKQAQEHIAATLAQNYYQQVRAKESQNYRSQVAPEQAQQYVATRKAQDYEAARRVQDYVAAKQAEDYVAYNSKNQDVAESRQWRRRLAPGLQSVYLDAEEEDEDKKPVKEDGESVVVGGEGAPGPSVASVKPAAIALAGPGGVASAAPVGTAVVGPGGLAIAAPSATAVAGPSGGPPPGALPGGIGSSRSNQQLYQYLEQLYAAPARRLGASLNRGAVAYDDDQ